MRVAGGAFELEIPTKLQHWHANSSQFCNLALIFAVGAIIAVNMCEFPIRSAAQQCAFHSISYASKTLNILRAGRRFRKITTYYAILRRQIKAFRDHCPFSKFLNSVVRQMSENIAPGVLVAVSLDDSSDFSISPIIAECFHQNRCDTYEIRRLCRQNESLHFMGSGIRHISLDRAQ